MKNLKKILSLVLALAMALSLMTVAFAKDTGDFADGDDVTYAEAVDVMATVGVFNGVGDGSNFDPNGTLTREQAAKIITYMLIGQTQADKLVATIAPFADVSADRWSAGAIAYCASEGIMNGTGNGKFNPTGELTGLQFAKMLLVALGYDAEIEEMTGVAWGLATSKLAYDIELDDGLAEDVNLTGVLTREQAAQMALTTMKTPTVRYPDKGSTISVNGAVVQFGAREAEYVTSTIAREQTISDQQLSNTNYYTIEFAEKYCPKLELKADIDAFGRPSYTWAYDRNEIATYIDSDLLIGEYTAKVTGQDLYNLIGSTTLKDDNTTIDIYIDGQDQKNLLKNTGDGNGSDIEDFYFDAGKIVKGNTDAVGGTGKGVLTQVFEKTTTNNRNTTTHITIAIINTYLAQADADYAAKQDKVTYTVYSVENIGTSGAPVLVKNTNLHHSTGAAIVANLTVKGEDFDNAAIVTEAKEDDIVLVTVADGAIQTIETPDVLADTEISAFKTASNVTVEGTKYEYATTAKYDVEVLDNYTGDGSTNLKDKTYNVYLDPYGYVIGVEEVEGADNYVFITGYDGNYSNLSNKTADMGAIFLDGTMKTIKVKTKDSSDELFNRASAGKKYAVAATTSSTDANSNGVTDADELYDAAIVNLWCTYTVNDNDEYTLTVVDGSGKANQSVQSAYTGNAKITIDEKRVQILGADGNYVFGNDETVYINAELDDVTVGYNKTALIIDDIDSVTVGARNVSLEVTDKTSGSSSTAYKPIYEVYTLYKESGRDIIGMITLDAEDNGTNSVYAYVTSKNVTQESYNKTDKEYTWSREVVIDGVKTEVNYTGSEIDKINPGNTGIGSTDDQMDQGYWYELKLDGNGNVRKAKAIDFTTASDEYANVVDEVVNIWDAGDDVDILWTQNYTTGTAITKLKFDRGTLWVNEANTTGITVATDVKVVVCNANDSGSTAFDSVTDGYTGYSGVTGALADLNKNFTGYVSAVYDGGKAKVIILDCTAGKDGYNAGGNQGNDVDGVSVDLTNAAAVEVLYTGDAPSEPDALDAILAALEKEGKTIENTELATSGSDAGKYIIETSYKSGNNTIKKTYKWDPSDLAAGVAIQVDGNDKLVASDATVGAATGKTESDKLYVKDGDGAYVSTDTTVSEDTNYISEKTYVVVTGVTVSGSPLADSTLTNGNLVAAIDIDDATGLDKVGTTYYAEVGATISLKVTYNTSHTDNTTVGANAVKVEVASGHATNQAQPTMTAPSGGTLLAAGAEVKTAANGGGEATVSFRLSAPATLSADTAITVTISKAP